VRAELGIDLPRAGESPNGAQRQRALRETGMDLREVYAATVQETAETYGLAAEVRR
jgi:hypothetical protein